jgi:putative transposase
MKRKQPLVVGKIYHIYNRGVAKGIICKEEADFWRFLQGLVLFNDKKTAANILWQLQKTRGRLTLNILKNYLAEQGEERESLVRIIAYSIMDNHFHLLIEEIQEGGITKFMQKLGRGYAGYFNNKYERVGGLFQGRFKNALVENEQYLLYLLVYINVLNPAGLIESNWKEKGLRDIKKVLKFAAEYSWSSHQDYIGTRKSLIIDRKNLNEILPLPQEYVDLVDNVLMEKKYTEINHLILE